MSRRKPSLPPLAVEPKVDASKRAGIVGLVLIVPIVATFWSVVTHGPVQIDDLQAIFKNPRMNPPAFESNGVFYYFHHGDPGLYLPFYYLFIALLAKATYVSTPDANGIFLDPRVFHAASLAIHTINALLVFALILRLMRREWPAVVGALLFALHPLQVETVAWTVGLRDLFFATFTLSIVYLYVLAAADGQTPRVRRSLYIAGLCLVPIGMLFKPTVMVAPLIAGVIDSFILGRPWRKVAWAAGPYLLAAVPLALVARAIQPLEAVPSPPLWQRPIVAGASLAFYAGKLVAPVSMGFDYGWRPLEMLAKPWFWGVGGAGAAVCAAILLGNRRWRWPAAAVGVFVAGVLPALGLTPFSFQFFSTVADHYLAAAMLGPALLAAWAARKVPWPWSGGWVVVLIALGLLSARQLTYWRDGPTMAAHMVDVNPASALGHNALGEIAQNKGDLATAEREFRAATRNPDFLAAPDNLTRLYGFECRADDAIDAFRLMVKTANRFPADARPDYSHFLSNVLVPYAEDLHRFADRDKYLLEQSRVFPSHLTIPPGRK